MRNLFSGRPALRTALCSAALLLPLAVAADPAPMTAPAAPATSGAKPTAPAAQPAPSTQPDAARDEDRARRRADRQAYFAAHLAALHVGLQLTPEQESLWTPVATALTDLSQLHHRHGRGMDEGRSIDELKQRSQRLIARGEAIGKLADATAPFVAALTIDQKDRLPVLLEGLRPRRLLARAFAVDVDRGAPERDGMRGPGPDGDRWDRSYADRSGMDRGDVDGREMDGDGRGMRCHRPWNRFSEGEDGPGDDGPGFDRGWHRHHAPDESGPEDGDRT